MSTETTDNASLIISRLDNIVKLLESLSGCTIKPPKKPPRQRFTPEQYDAVLDRLERVLTAQALAGRHHSARDIERHWVKQRGNLPISGRTLRAILRKAIQEGDLIRAPQGWLSAPPDR